MLKVNLEGLKSKWNGLDNTKKKVVVGASALLLSGSLIGGTWLGYNALKGSDTDSAIVKKVVEINNDAKRKAEQKRVELKKAEEAKKKAEETKKDLENKLKEAKTEEEKKKINKEISETEKTIKKEAEVVAKATEEVKRAENGSTSNIAVAVSPVVEVKDVKKVVENKPAPKPAKPVEKPVTPSKPAEKPVAPKPAEPAKPVTPVKPVEPAKPVAPSVVSTSKESKSENKDYVNFGYDTVYDSNKAKGTSGISKEGTQGYTTYNYTRTVTKYSDGSVKYGDWVVASKNVVAPVNGVKWVGTYEEPAKTGYINNQGAYEVINAINSARKANGKAEVKGIVTNVAEEAYIKYWSKGGLGHIGYGGGECVAYWSTGQDTVDAWMSDGHRNSLLADGSTFAVSVYTDSEGISWTVFYWVE